MTLISKAAGALSLISCIHDIHKTALISSNKEYSKAAANSVVSLSVNHQKADNISFKDAQRKNWLSRSNYFASIKEGFAKIKGYVKGFLNTSLRYIPNFACAALALLMGKKHDKIANIAALGLGIIESFDFVKNSLSPQNRDDYLNLK
ncbi:MAG: hypothetical protein IJB79_07765 [Candidatus Gastranaerophilales bacterium]|nr:hypothetical protein [Candidatus Gastranaerophilales bacterium]